MQEGKELCVKREQINPQRKLHAKPQGIRDGSLQTRRLFSFIFKQNNNDHLTVKTTTTRMQKTKRQKTKQNKNGWNSQ